MLWRETAKTERIVCSTTECRLKEVNEKAALISEIPECMLNMWLQTTSPYVLQRVSKSCKETIFNRNSKDELMSGFVFYVCRASLSLPKAVQKEYNNERGMYANMSAQTVQGPYGSKQIIWPRHVYGISFVLYSNIPRIRGSQLLIIQPNELRRLMQTVPGKMLIPKS